MKSRRNGTDTWSGRTSVSNLLSLLPTPGPLWPVSRGGKKCLSGLAPAT